MENRNCEYATIRKNFLDKEEYAKCKLTKDDCWIFYNKNACKRYHDKNPKKTFTYHRGNFSNIEDYLKEMKC